MLNNCRALAYQFATLEARRELEPKSIPQLFLGSLLGTRRSAIGQFFPSPQKQSQKSLQKLTRPSFFLVGLCRNTNHPTSSISELGETKLEPILTLLVP